MAGPRLDNFEMEAFETEVDLTDLEAFCNKETIKTEKEDD